MKKAFSILSLCMIFLTGCGSVQTEGSAPPSNPTQGTDHDSSASTDGANQNKKEQPKSDPSSIDTPNQEKSIKIQAYYTDSNLTELQSEQKELTYQKESDKYRLALKWLEKPANHEYVPLFQNFKVNQISLQDGKLTVDVSDQNVYNFGSSAEEMAIEALLKTMFQFPEIQQVEILINGKQAETLAGHVDISQPFSKMTTE